MEDKEKLTLGILAHVDAGKTTLAESILYLRGSIRKIGRVDTAMPFSITMSWSDPEESQSSPNRQG